MYPLKRTPFGRFWGFQWYQPTTLGRLKGFHATNAKFMTHDLEVCQNSWEWLSSYLLTGSSAACPWQASTPGPWCPGWGRGRSLDTGEDSVLLSSSCCGIRVTRLEAVEVVVSVQRADAGRLGLARARHDGLSAPRAHQREHPEHCDDGSAAVRCRHVVFCPYFKLKLWFNSINSQYQHLKATNQLNTFIFWRYFAPEVLTIWQWLHINNKTPLVAIIGPI